MNNITKLKLFNDSTYLIGKNYDQDILDINNNISSINTTLNDKANKSTTLSGYGITDSYTKTDIDSKLNGKANTSHTHDDRYYTETETNNLLNNKANSFHIHDDRYYTEAEVNNLLNNKSNTSHTHDDRYYTETETNNLLNNKSSRFINGIYWVVNGYTAVLSPEKIYLLIFCPEANGDIATNLNGIFVIATGAFETSKHWIHMIYRSSNISGTTKYYPIINGFTLNIVTDYQYMNYSLTEL